jgi:hypothetical protein
MEMIKQGNQGQGKRAVKAPVVGKSKAPKVGKGKKK